MRRVLPHRRHCETETIHWADKSWTFSVGYFEDGNPAEIFVTGVKAGSDMEALARDACVAVSIAIQHGTPIAALGRAMLADASGAPSSLIGAIVSHLSKKILPDTQEAP
jgi:hypothetical protein